MNRKLFALTALVALGLAFPRAGRGATARDLQDLLSRGEPVTVVDIRGAAAFAEAHIPGAMNVPAEIVAEKRLPPLGRVVVCGDGLRAGDLARAVAALNVKPGIRAESLEGGMAAWEALAQTSTREGGLGKRGERYVSYDELQQAALENPNLVLVDLRQVKLEAAAAQQVAGSSARKSGAPAEDDLAGRFANRERVRLERGPGGQVSAAKLTARKDQDHRKVYVLIDDGDGEAEKVAHRLKAAGIGQVVILAGGDRAIVRDGKAGLRSQESGQ